MANLEAAENNIVPNKERILNVVGLTANSPVYGEVLKEYDNSLKIFSQLCDFKYSFLIEEKELFQCSHTAYVALTLGEAVTKEVNELFEKGNYLRGIILNAVCDDYLMQADSFVAAKLTEHCTDMGINVVKRYYPHENVESRLTKVIADKLCDLRLTVNEEFAVSPEKTFIYLAALDKCKTGNIEHDCKVCGNLNCRWRR